MIEHIHFMRKLRRYIKKGLASEQPDEAAKEQFFVEVKEDLMQMSKIYYKPFCPPEYQDANPEFNKLFYLRGSALHFINQRIGTDYTELFGNEFQSYNRGSAGFGALYQLPQLLKNSSQWRNLLLYHTNYASKSMTNGGPSPHAVSAIAGLGMAHLKKMRDNFEAQEKLMAGHEGKEIVQFEYYRVLVDSHRKMIDGVPKLEQEIKSLGSHSEEADANW
ncbi:hypothetical protein PtA15_17A93 [Puccinia triticina]|uniref:Uncharacterized protein n=1 Tax=Puccinia triticina TaxID=208348 RepID=A0ABY7D8L7_9BASI|nr:uncharacterized protein PtA15_17A93 [Puccinia triticina]WAQ92612.1 hypothetical protein PtA15_17A93 [Puccinia triticina]